MGRLCNIKVLFIKHMRPYECHGAIRTNDDDIKHIKKIKLISSGFISFAEMIKNIFKPVIFFGTYTISCGIQGLKAEVHTTISSPEPSRFRSAVAEGPTQRQ